MDAYLWWQKPKNKEEVPSYMDLLFKYAGDNLWTKILKPRVQEELEQEVEKKAALQAEGDKK